MQFVASVPDTRLIPAARESGADIIELRLDLADSLAENDALAALESLDIPLILTLRSRDEGGRFSGSPGEWWERLQAFLPYATYVDIEGRFRALGNAVRDGKKTIIASYHTPSMPDPSSLAALLTDLASFGDIPKIVVSPQSGDDVLSLLSFTLHAKKPVITSIMGSRFSFARMILPLFGSSFLFCHAGHPTAEGQVHVRVARDVLGVLAGEDVIATRVDA
ncbi:MAG: type I 3-dehydroquinate dehydratase [Methanolinea sp.]|nr:type I 3-dehydroquinate dehydratase [Methanolinea sp.]